MDLYLRATVFLASLLCSDCLAQMVGQTAQTRGCKSNMVVSNFPHTERPTFDSSGMALECFNTARDCTKVSLARAFPDLYNLSEWTPPRVARVRLTPFCRLDNEQVNQSGVIMEWGIPDNSGAQHLKGFGIRVEENWWRSSCYVIRLAAQVTRENGNSTFRGEFYPLSRDTHVFVYLSTLPSSLTSEETVEFNVSTTKCERPNSSNVWCPNASSFYGIYDVINKTLTIRFEAAPFPISDYVIRSSGLHVDTAKIQNETSYTYFGVLPGTYSFDIQLLDGFPNDAGRCQCRDDEGRCNHCNTCRGYTFSVPDETIHMTETIRLTGSQNINHRTTSSRDIGIVFSLSGLLVAVIFGLFVLHRMGFTVDCGDTEDISHGDKKRLVVLERQRMSDIGRDMKINFMRNFRSGVLVDHIVCTVPFIEKIKQLYTSQTSTTVCMNIFKNIKIVQRKQACLCICVVLEDFIDTNIEQTNEILLLASRYHRKNNVHLCFVSRLAYPDNMSEKTRIFYYRTDTTTTKVNQFFLESLQIPSSDLKLGDVCSDRTTYNSPVTRARVVSYDSGKGSSCSSYDCAVPPGSGVILDPPRHHGMCSALVYDYTPTEYDSLLEPTTVFRRGKESRCIYTDEFLCYDAFGREFLCIPPELEDEVLKDKVSSADSLEAIMDEMAALNGRFESYSEETLSLLTGDVYSVFECFA
ncbi:uncharacterized protein LOC127843092 [Dreissena polymorpha]|uniref:Uncharacterized protein n=1 Tax=Dreissena polymorpha TaxID=45954 RepID=A0A9D4IZ84_DREPO|nr:uncharacterized protein LOC127843092 [Dreissena polymorpha]KAH3789798.1 hypothetical protein DPMN_167986 [Dreissena polymorpha]